MEIFPYDCTVCEGAYKRCAYGGHVLAEGEYTEEVIPCEDGQFCWEEDCFIQVLEQIHTLDETSPIVLESIPLLKAKYDGYGHFLVDDPLYSTYYFVEYDMEEAYDKNTFLVFATCASCHDPDLCKLCKDDRCDRH